MPEPESTVIKEKVIEPTSHVEEPQVLQVEESQVSDFTDRPEPTAISEPRQEAILAQAELPEEEEQPQSYLIQEPEPMGSLEKPCRDLERIIEIPEEREFQDVGPAGDKIVNVVITPPKQDARGATAPASVEVVASAASSERSVEKDDSDEDTGSREVSKDQPSPE